MRPRLPSCAVCESFRCAHVQCGMGTALVEVWSPERCCPYKSCGKSLHRDTPSPKEETQGPGREAGAGPPLSTWLRFSSSRATRGKPSNGLPPGFIRSLSAGHFFVSPAQGGGSLPQ